MSAQLTLNIAASPMISDGEPRAKLWDEAREIAYKKLPTILEAIRSEASAVIHGDE